MRFRVTSDSGWRDCFTMSAKPGRSRESTSTDMRIGAQIARLVLRRLKYPKRVVDRVAHLVEQHMFRYEPRWSDAVRRFIKRVGVEHLDDIFELRRADRGINRGLTPGSMICRASRRSVKRAFLTLANLAMNGNDVKALIGPDAPHGHRRRFRGSSVKS